MMEILTHLDIIFFFNFKKNNQYSSKINRFTTINVFYESYYVLESILLTSTLCTLYLGKSLILLHLNTPQTCLGSICFHLYVGYIYKGCKWQYNYLQKYNKHNWNANTYVCKSIIMCKVHLMTITCKCKNHGAHPLGLVNALCGLEKYYQALDYHLWIVTCSTQTILANVRLCEIRCKLNMFYLMVDTTFIKVVSTIKQNI
jgi:hypothetical protein